MSLAARLRRIVPFVILLGFLAGTASCVLRTEPTGRSGRSVHHAKHQHQHCHEKRHKKHKKHKRHKRMQVCHSHMHDHPHH